MNAKIDELKEKHRKELKNYGDQVSEYVDKHGNDNCEYLLHRRMMEHYHRGAYNVLIELERD